MPNLPAYLYLIGPSRVPPGAERGHTGASARAGSRPGHAPGRLTSPSEPVKTAWIVARAVDGAAVVIGHLLAGLRPGRLGQLRAPAIERKPQRKPPLPVTPGHSSQESSGCRPRETCSRPPTRRGSIDDRLKAEAVQIRLFGVVGGDSRARGSSADEPRRRAPVFTLFGAHPPRAAACGCNQPRMAAGARGQGDPGELICRKQWSATSCWGSGAESGIRAARTRPRLEAVRLLSPD